MITHYVGIDISYKTATVAWQITCDMNPIVMEIPQTSQAYRDLIQQLNQLTSPSHIQIVMEATGSYWMAIAHALFDAGFVVSVVNPADPKHFAKLQRQHAKTDRIDAILLMQFAQFQQPPAWSPPPEICEHLRQLLTLRDQLMELRTQVGNQLHALRQNPHALQQVLALQQGYYDQLNQDIKQLKLQIHNLLTRESEWARVADYLLSIPGIATISAAWLLVATHCFVRCDTPEQAASFAGLAPHPHDSGNKSGYRSIGGTGHKALRNTLYMASAPASRFNPILKPYYEDLVKRGKPKKVARCAVARKLIHIAWACVTKQRYFDPNFQQQTQVA